MPIHPVALSRVRSRLRMRHLVFIEALALRKSIRQAAQDLFITQPAASKLLTEIEIIFGAKLFERTEHGVQPTLQGEILLHWAVRALSDMDVAQTEIAALDAGWAGLVRVGAFPVAAPVLVPDAIVVLRNTRPQIKVCLHEGLEDTLIPLLEKGLIDCVVGRMTSQPKSREVSTEILFEESTVVVCRPDHPLLGRTAWTAHELNSYNWVLPSTVAPLYGLVTAGLAAFSADAPRVSVETSSILMLMEILMQTDMLSAIPEGVANRFVRTGQLAILPLPLSITLHPVCIITASRIPLNSATLTYLDAIREVARGYQKSMSK